MKGISSLVSLYRDHSCTNSIIFRFYYQHDTGHISACPVTIHTLLHIANSIKTCEPVWCYWAFPMEHYCNHLKPAICNWQSPYATINWYILEDAQLTQIKAIYNLADKLALQPCQRDLPLGAYQSPCCKSSPLWVTYLTIEIWFPHWRPNLHTPVSSHCCSTRHRQYIVTIRFIEINHCCPFDTNWSSHFNHLEISSTSDNWRVGESSADQQWCWRYNPFLWSDEALCRSLGCNICVGESHFTQSPTGAHDGDDQYVMLVDQFTHMHCHKPQLKPKTFYGQLEHLYLITFACSDTHGEPQKLVILAAIWNCKIKDPGPADLKDLDIHLYNMTGGLDITDVTNIQALVSHVEYKVDGSGWGLINWSGGLACAE